MSASAGRLAAVAWACAGLLAPALAADPPPARRPAAAKLAAADDVRKRLGLSPAYDAVRGLDRVKVAVLDYGFEGYDGTRPYLPANTVIVEHYDPEFVRRFDLGDPGYRKGFEPGNAHGRLMAQIAWAVAGGRPDGPQFYLLNANGPTLFRRAVRYAIEAKVDVLLFSGVFEGGGNYDGRGPINRAVDDAIRAGILWVNAAGNFGRLVYNGPVRVADGGYVRLGPHGTALRFRNRLDENTVTVTLTWNDYRDAEDAGTRKDLDLIVEGWDGAVIGTGGAVQVAGDAAAGPGQSRNPRERVVLTDLAGDADKLYRIRVKARAGPFGPADRLRILVTPAQRLSFDDPRTGHVVPAVELLEATGTREVYPPADHPGVLTVGDAGPESSVGPTADGRLKPDVLVADSRAVFTNGEVTTGSSNAAAFVAGAVAVLKAARPGLRLDDLHRHAAALARAAPARGDGPPEMRQAVSRSMPAGAPRDGFGLPWPAYGTSAEAAQADEVRAQLARRLWRAPTPAELAALAGPAIRPGG